MSAKFPRDFFLCPEIRLHSQCEAVFSGYNKQTGNFSGFTQTSFFLFPVKLVILAWLQAVTQRSSCTSTITRMASKTTWGGEEKARGGAPALNWLHPVVLIYWLEWVTWVCPNYKEVLEMKNEWVSTKHRLFFLLEKRDLPIAFW